MSFDPDDQMIGLGALDSINNPEDPMSKNWQGPKIHIMHYLVVNLQAEQENQTAIYLHAIINYISYSIFNINQFINIKS